MKGNIIPCLKQLLLIAILISISCTKREWDNPFEKDHTVFTFIDNRDNQVYKAIHIGSQVWMAENLNYYVDNGSWAYDNNLSSTSIYGRLYDWQTACNVCPDGWHLPSDAEWATLTDYLGGENIAGGEMKETSTNHWQSPNTGANNNSGFAVLPGGNRNNYGIFVNMGYYTYFWSSTESYSDYAWTRLLYYNNIDVYHSYDLKALGFSVRCIKD
ncbi:fibrobacter succinogenes major paralogous domain-containing protein [Bacteroidota bacterium]